MSEVPTSQHGIYSSSKFVVDVWLVIMRYLSVLDIIRLGSVSLRQLTTLFVSHFILHS